MNKQRKVLITITYNEMGIIIDTKAEEVPQPNLQPTCKQLATDTISRQAAIDAIVKMTNCNGVRELYEYVQKHHLSDMWSGGIVDAIDAVIAVPAAEPGPKWIPCSEKKPEKSGKYYVSGGGKVWICEYAIISNFACAIGGWCNDASNPVVQAWMPLPEPYKGE